MKITLDLDRLLAEGTITREECERLEALAAGQTASLALNVLVAFGVVAVAGATLALLESVRVAIALGVVIAASGVYADRAGSRRWESLGVILLLVGSLTAGGGVVWLTNGSAWAFLLLSVAFGAASLLARSGLMAALSALSLLAASGGWTGYAHAAYFLGIEQPLLTVVLFGVLGFLSHRASLAASADHARLATVFSRTCLFIVNLGFWIGSLWGDRMWRAGEEGDLRATTVIPDWAFAIAWAAGLVAVGVWAARRNRRWIVNVVAVFGAIHFYTQYFERLGASPGSVLVAGLVALGIAVVLLQYNRSRSSDVREAA